MIKLKIVQFKSFNLLIDIQQLKNILSLIIILSCIYTF